MFTYSKGYKKPGAGWEYSNTVEEQVDDETRQRHTGAGCRGKVEQRRRQRLVTQQCTDPAHT